MPISPGAMIRFRERPPPAARQRGGSSVSDQDGLVHGQRRRKRPCSRQYDSPHSLSPMSAQSAQIAISCRPARRQWRPGDVPKRLKINGGVGGSPQVDAARRPIDSGVVALAFAGRAMGWAARTWLFGSSSVYRVRCSSRPPVVAPAADRTRRQSAADDRSRAQPD